MFVSVLAASGCVSPGEHSPGRFEHHPAIEVSLFAAEPDVVDPVALAFAANGDCFVVEMRDYPYGFGPERNPGGTIRLLRDTNRDGKADESTVFAENLSFPTSILPWRDGVLVLAPPRVLYLKDTDGDDRADVFKVLLDGLILGVTDSNSNSLRWGLDNRVHAVNGGNGGTLMSPLNPSRRTRLSGADYAFDPDTGRIERTSGTAKGFGLVFDPWGHSFTTYNTDYLQQRIIPVKYLKERPELPAVDATVNISDHGEWPRIYPIATAVTRVNHPEQAGHFSSAGGMALIDDLDHRFSADLSGSIFVCDVVSNLVHRDRLHESGPIFRGHRAPEEETSEFLASRDPAFRPIGLEHGPDGALYLIDMQRDVIEHPDFIPAKVLEKLDIRAGDDRGRIYRIVPRKNVEKREGKNEILVDGRTETLVRALFDGSPWRRQTAQRLLYEKQPSDLEGTLRSTGLGRDNPRARVRALWLLQALGKLTPGDMSLALEDPHPGVRENGIILAEGRFPDWPTGLEMVLELTADPHPRVRFQAALSLNGTTHERKLSSLLQMLLRDFEHEWSRNAVWVAIDGEGARLLEELWKIPEWSQMSQAGGTEEIEESRTSALLEAAEVAAAGLTEESREKFSRWLEGLSFDDVPLPQASGLLRGLFRGWSRRPSRRLDHGVNETILGRWSGESSPELDLELLDLHQLLREELTGELLLRVERAYTEAASRELDPNLRLKSIEKLSRLVGDRSHALLVGLLSPSEPTAIQKAALEALQRLGNDGSGAEVVQAWTKLSPRIRVEAVHFLLSRRAYHDALVSGLEEGQIQFSELNLDLEQRRLLLRLSTPEIAKRAKKFFGDEEYSNRRDLVEEWLERLPAEGNAEEGGKIYAEKCAKCHRSGTMGHQVGPDLTSVSHRSVEDLLTHILDPNMSINPGYVTCVVVSDVGEILTGLLVSDTRGMVTLLQSEEKRVEIPRGRIASFSTLTTSLMPEGLEAELTPEEMFSLILFLQQGQEKG